MKVATTGFQTESDVAGLTKSKHKLENVMKTKKAWDSVIFLVWFSNVHITEMKDYAFLNLCCI